MHSNAASGYKHGTPLEYEFYSWKYKRVEVFLLGSLRRVVQRQNAPYSQLREVHCHANTLITYIIQNTYTTIYIVTHHVSKYLEEYTVLWDRLCGLVVRDLGYRSGDPGSIPGTTRKKVVGLERDPLSLVSTTEELLDRKVAAPV
jgi:hypothetical protein